MLTRRPFSLFAASVVILAAVLQSCSRPPQEREAAFLNTGETLLAQKQYARAILEFRNAIRAMPQDAEPFYQLGLVCLQVGDLYDANQAFQRATVLNPKHLKAQTKLGELMNMSQKSDLLQDAASRLKRVLQASPDDEEATDALAVTELQMGNDKDATHRLQESLQKFPSRLKSSVALARMMLIENDLQGAETVLRRAIALAPDSSAAHLALGQIYVLQEKVEQAAPEIAKAIQLDPKNSSALLTLALLQIRGKSMIEAEKTLNQLSSLPNKQYKDLHATFVYELGKHDAAISELKALLAADPDNRAMRSRLFAMYVDTNQQRDAEGLLADALKRNPRDSDALFDRAQLYLETGKPRQAEQDIKEVLHIQPDSARTHFELARVYAAEGLMNSERQELSETLRLDNTFLAARLALAKSFVLTNEREAALSALNDASDSQKNTVAVLVARNWALLEAGHLDAVRLSLDQILRVARTPEALLQDGLLRMEQKDYAGARSDAEQVLKLKPQDSRGARLLADTYIAEHEIPQATQQLAALAASHPNAPSMQLLVGQWYLRNGQIAEAQKAFAAALASDSNLVPASLNLAEIDHLDHLDAAARNRLQGLLANHPGNVPALLLLASVSDAMGDKAGEIAAYKSALAVDSSNEYALNNLAYALALKNPDAALPLAQRAVAIAPDNAAAQDTLGWIYFRKGMYPAAVNHLKTAVDSDPSPRREFHLAMSYVKAGHPESGKELLRAALKQDPTLPTTEQGW